MYRTAILALLVLAACAAPETAAPAPAEQVPEAEAPAPKPAPVVPTTAPVLYLDGRPLAPVSSAVPAQPVVAAQPQRPQGELPLRTRLRNTRLPSFVIEEEESLRKVTDNIAIVTGLPIVVAPTAEAAVMDEGVLFEFNLTNPISAKDLLNIVERMAGDEVQWIIRHDVVMFVTKEKAYGTKTLRLYDIQTLTFARTDFIAPRIDRLRLLDELEDDDGGGPFGGVGERVSETTPEDVMTMVQENIAPGTWEEDGVMIDVAEGSLIVVHTADVHERVRRFLATLGN